jgi:hypothetical protein
VKRNELIVLSAVYSATDCCNEVYDYAKLHHRQTHIADEMVTRGLLVACDGVVSVDGDGFITEPERYGTGYRLTLAGYEALTAWQPDVYPVDKRRFSAALAGGEVQCG